MDLERTLPRAARAPALFGSPEPVAGLFWTAGSPAGLARDVERSWGELGVSLGGEGGSYRRPFDQDGVRVTRLRALRWQPVGRTAVIGRVIADETLSDVGGLSPEIHRHPSNPFVVADTTVSAMRLIRTRLEGGIGMRAGAWLAGFVGGLEVADHRTRRSPQPRLVRASTPALSVGIGRELPWADIAFSAYGRWQGSSETVRFIAWPALGFVYRLQGYEEPIRHPIGGSPDRLEFNRFIERDARAAGLAVSGKVLGADWTGYLERGRREDDHFSARTADPAIDRWRAEGWRWGGALGRPLGEASRILGAFEYSVLDGDAFRADLDGAIFRSHEESARGNLELRYTPAGPPWAMGLFVSIARESRTRMDHLVTVGSDLSAWTSGGALEIARRIGTGSIISVGGGASVYGPSPAIPDPEAMGPLYRELVGPEFGVYAARARGGMVNASVYHELTEGIALVARAHGTRLAPNGESALAPLAPDGSRTSWILSITGVWER